MHSRFKVASKAAQRHYTPIAHRIRLEVVDELTKEGIYDAFNADVCAGIFYARYRQKMNKLSKN